MKISFFLVKKIKITLKNIFLDIPSSYAKILGEINFHAREIPPKLVKSGRRRRKRKKILQGLGVARCILTRATTAQIKNTGLCWVIIMTQILTHYIKNNDLIITQSQLLSQKIMTSGNLVDYFLTKT